MIKWGKLYIDVAQNTIWKIHVMFYDPEASFQQTTLLGRDWKKWNRNPYQERLDISINQENSIAFSSSKGIYCSQGLRLKEKVSLLDQARYQICSATSKIKTKVVLHREIEKVFNGCRSTKGHVMSRLLYFKLFCFSIPLLTW